MQASQTVLQRWKRVWTPCFTKISPRTVSRFPAARRRRSPLPAHSIRTRPSSSSTSQRRRWTPSPRRRSTVSSMRSQVIRLPSISPTASPPANSATRSPCSTRARSFSRVVTPNCSPIGAANTTRSGTHRRSIIRSEVYVEQFSLLRTALQHRHTADHNFGRDAAIGGTPTRHMAVPCAAKAVAAFFSRRTGAFLLY